MTRALLRSRRAAAASRASVLLAGAALVAAAACGRGDNQSADRNGADTTSADRSATGAERAARCRELPTGVQLLKVETRYGGATKSPYDGLRALGASRVCSALRAHLAELNIS